MPAMYHSHDPILSTKIFGGYSLEVDQLITTILTSVEQWLSIL